MRRDGMPAVEAVAELMGRGEQFPITPFSLTEGMTMIWKGLALGGLAALALLVCTSGARADDILLGGRGVEAPVLTLGLHPSDDNQATELVSYRGGYYGGYRGYYGGYGRGWGGYYGGYGRGWGGYYGGYGRGWGG